MGRRTHFDGSVAGIRLRVFWAFNMGPDAHLHMVDFTLSSPRRPDAVYASQDKENEPVNDNAATPLSRRLLFDGYEAVRQVVGRLGLHMCRLRFSTATLSA